MDVDLVHSLDYSSGSIVLLFPDNKAIVETLNLSDSKNSTNCKILLMAVIWEKKNLSKHIVQIKYHVY